jgi:hypothetical protein
MFSTVVDERDFVRYPGTGRDAFREKSGLWQ